MLAKDAEKPLTPTEGMELLRGSVWHTTSQERFNSILQTGEILAEPPAMNEDERWGTAIGPNGYPFGRSIGAISLFDFRDAIFAEYEKNHPPHWANFVPCYHKWDAAIWIEIDVAALGERFISGEELLRRWGEKGEFGRNIIPMIEAACMGSLPISCFRRVLRLRPQPPTGLAALLAEARHRTNRRQ